MLASMKRALKSRQIGLVQTFHLVSGTAATPADSGLDKMYVASVQDLGVGSYKLTFKDSSRLNIAIAGLISVTPNVFLSIAAVDKVSVTIAAKNAAGTATDADFYMSCVHGTLVSDLY